MNIFILFSRRFTTCGISTKVEQREVVRRIGSTADVPAARVWPSVGGGLVLLCFTVMIALAIEAGNALALPISPNPNAGLITISGSDTNSVSFSNLLLGTIHAYGVGNTLENTSSGFLSNAGGINLELDAEFINRGALQNEGTGGIELSLGGSLMNLDGGNIVNLNNIWSEGFTTRIENNASVFSNYGELRNQDDAVLSNRSGALYNDGGDLIFNRSAALFNIEGSLLVNQGGGNIYIRHDSRLGNAGASSLLVNRDDSFILLVNGSTLINDPDATIENTGLGRIIIGTNTILPWSDSTLENMGIINNTGSQTQLVHSTI